MERVRSLLDQILVVVRSRSAIFNIADIRPRQGSPFGGDLKHWKWMLNFYVDCEIWFQRSGGSRVSDSSKACLSLFERISAERKV